MKHTLIANLKSYKTLTDLKEWRDFLIENLGDFDTDKLFLAPPSPYFYLFSTFNLLSQDVSPFPPGSYTGAVNVTHLLDFHIKGSLVGHSERRRYFHETDQDVANKIELLLDYKLLPVVCLNRDNLQTQIELIDSKFRPHCLFAYEPISAIGTDNPADPEEVAETFRLIANLTDTSKILYGGSIHPDNTQDYLNLPYFGGFLVGHAILDPSVLLQLIKQLQ